MSVPTSTITSMNKLAWFAGLIDGEGCFTLNIRKQHTAALKVTPVFSIQMKNGKWLKNVLEILKKLNIKYYYRERKNQAEISVKHWKNILPFIRAIKSFSVVKRPLIEQFLLYKPKPIRNRFISTNPKIIRETANFVDFVREFNRGKNRPYKWSGNKVLNFFEEKK